LQQSKGLFAGCQARRRSGKKTQKNYTKKILMTSPSWISFGVFHAVAVREVLGLKSSQVPTGLNHSRWPHPSAGPAVTAGSWSANCLLPTVFPCGLPELPHSMAFFGNRTSYTVADLLWREIFLGKSYRLSKI